MTVLTLTCVTRGRNRLDLTNRSAVRSTTSASATGHHDLLCEEELVDFSALLPRPDYAELARRLAVVRGRLADDSLGIDFFEAGRGRLDGGALDIVFLVAGRDAEDLAGDAPAVLVPSEAGDASDR